MTDVTIRRALSGMVLAGATGLLLGAAAARAADAPAVPGKAAIEQVVREYILSHPEIIPEAMDRLRNRESAKAIGADRTALEKPFASAWAGNPQGDVTLVMFTDYSCGYCKASAPDIEKLLAEDPKLKVVWREIPVLGPQSEVAAHDALAAAKQGKYLAFHRTLFAGGRPDQNGLKSAAKAAGVDSARLTAERNGADIEGELRNNLSIAQRLGVTGTPSFVIGNRMLNGAVGHEALAKAIAQARAG